MVTLPLQCPFCESNEVGKNGTANGKPNNDIFAAMMPAHTKHSMPITSTTVANLMSKKTSSKCASMAMAFEPHHDVSVSVASPSSPN